MTSADASKAERERAALRVVYDEAEFESVVHDDRPDFIMQHRGSKSRFGVEVTDLYPTESAARLEHHPHYITELFAGGPHMHRDDVTELKVTTVSIRDAGGNLKAEGVPAVLSQTRPDAEHGDAIAEVLRRKSAKVAGYDPSLSHLNLIIVDKFDMSLDVDDGYSTSDLLTPELRAALRETPFREVFLAATCRDGRRVYRPLQALLLMEAFFLFMGAINESETLMAVLDLEDLVPLFVSVMRAVDGLSVHQGDAGGACAVYRGVGVRYAKSGMNVLDFRDHEPPPNLASPKPPLDDADLTAFVDQYSRFVTTKTFMTAMAISEYPEA